MATKELFDQVSFETSKITTLNYSTSFSLGIRCLSKRMQEAIFNIYGYVRFADEIVDTFHQYNKEELFYSFKEDTFKALKDKISLNPILNSFQKTVHQYNIDPELIHTFLRSMEMDLKKNEYNQINYDEYILGSAEVVGLMCLKVFCEGDQNKYNHLKHFAMKLGSAFQKINFLRDIKEDSIELGRVYFPNLDISKFNSSSKKEIEDDIDELLKHQNKKKFFNKNGMCLFEYNTNYIDFDVFGE